MLKLLKVPGFAAFIAVAFINAFVDLGHKIIIQNTLFKVYDGDLQILLTALVNGLILLPFILLFTPSGFLSDRFAKTRVMQISAASALVICGLITLCYYAGWFIAAFAFTFVLALQSALYSPAKYGFIREQLGLEHLGEGNAWLQGVTMVAILAGILVFSLLFENLFAQALVRPESPEQTLQQIAPLGWVLMASAAVELLLALRLPKQAVAQPELAFDWPAYRTGKLLKTNLALVLAKRPIWLSIAGLTLFWGLSQVMLAVFPAFAEQRFAEDNTFVIQGVMALAGIGIMFGSVLAGRWSHGYINTGLIPLGALGVAVSLCLLPLAPSLLMSAPLFLLTGFSGALMVIPLNALVQFHADDSRLGRVLAGRNLLENTGMLALLGITMLAALWGIAGVYLLGALAVLAVAGAWVALKALPEAFIRLMLLALMGQRYRVKVQGFEHLPPEGEGALLLGNHVSWLDWAMVQMACPRHITFVMERSIYERWYLKWFLDRYKVIPISAGQNRAALDAVRERLNAGELVCLFPEGVISRTGQMNEFRRGFEIACQGAAGRIIPFHLHGLWGSRFSRSSKGLRQRRKALFKRDVQVSFGAPLPIDASAAQVKTAVVDLSVTAWQHYVGQLPAIGESFIRTARSALSQWAITDGAAPPLNHRRLLTACLLFAGLIKRRPEQNIGILLPTSTGGVIANLAAWIAGKTVINLNFTASEAAFAAALEQGEVRIVISARRFLDKLADKGIVLEPLLAGRELVLMDEVKDDFSKAQKLSALVCASLLPTGLLIRLFGRKVSAQQTAAVLFSSGSEGAPKGVMLSHHNLLANVKQCADVLNVQASDRLMATLPLFHAFGLTINCLFPLIEGVPVICHPDPTDARNIGRWVARHQATLLCATSTFLNIYTRNSKLSPLMFRSLRMVVAGAEKLQPHVRDAFEQKFHKQVLEGYGCTETAPVASVNTPDHLDTQWWVTQVAHKPGTVGLPVPGTRFAVVNPDTLEALPEGEAGLILVAGPQVMQGYLGRDDLTAKALVQHQGRTWYATGDKGQLDSDGFLTLVDRYSRFAKIGGEMVSLSAVEQAARECLADNLMPLVAVSREDARKGEHIVLLIEGSDQEAECVLQRLRASAINRLMLPVQVLAVTALPVLGSGKVDFREAQKIAVSRMTGRSD